ncbi:MAG: hypothetical protein FWD13_06750 [Treponema sp.]|nr:hypothetical protein [Treponema sp.]
MNKRNFFRLLGFIVIIAVMGFSTTACASTQSAAPQAVVTVTDIPLSYSGLYGSVSLTVYNNDGSFNWVAWSDPVLITGDSFSVNLSVMTNNVKTNNPFYKEGEFTVYIVIDQLNNEGLPIWQGYSTLRINDKTTIKSWLDFGEAAG